MSDKHARFAYIRQRGEWVPKLQAETDGGQSDE